MISQIFVFDRLVEEDGVRGDENGPFDPLTVKEERQRLADDKVTPPVVCLLHAAKRHIVPVQKPLLLTFDCAACLDSGMRHACSGLVVILGWHTAFLQHKGTNETVLGIQLRRALSITTVTTSETRFTRASHGI